MNAAPTRGRPLSSKRAPALPPAERRRAIIAATLPLLREHGTEISTRQIATAAGIAEGTIFRVFPDKDTLIQQAIAAAFEPSVMVNELNAIDRDLPLQPLLLAAVAIAQRQLTGVFALIAKIGIPRPPPTPGQEHQRSPDDVVMQVIVELLTPHETHLRLSAHEAGRMLRVMIFAGTHPHLSGGDILSPDEIVQLFLYGAIKTPASKPTTAPSVTKNPGAPSC